MTDSGARDRAEGTVEELKGKGKQAWGDMTDDERMKAEGMVDEAKGKAQQAWGDLKDKAEDLKEEVDRKI
ncbi:MAG: CsbD family protein [Thermomicrobiales bacterium]